MQIKVHWKRFIPFSPLNFFPEFVFHTEFKGRPEDKKWNVLYYTALRNYAAISLQVPSILSILLVWRPLYRIWLISSDWLKHFFKILGMSWPVSSLDEEYSILCNWDYIFKWNCNKGYFAHIKPSDWLELRNPAELTPGGGGGDGENIAKSPCQSQSFT